MASIETLSNRIRSLRTGRNLSQQQLADLMYVSRSTVANWESGNRVPDVSTLMRLSKIFGTDIYDLINVTDDVYSSPVIAVVEDEPVILTGFLHILEETLPDVRISGFQRRREVLDFACSNRIDVVFLDIELCGESGLEIAAALQDIYPQGNIIFLTGHSEYTRDALEIYCSGYIMKPLTPEKIRKEIAHLRFPIRGLSA